MAGGKGTRLSSLTHDEIPKPLVPVLGKPILLHQIETLKRQGVDKFIISVGHLQEKIIGFFGDGSNFDVRITYIQESVPLGSGGALFYLKDKLEGDFLILSGDTVFDIDVNRMLDFHTDRGSLFTLFTHPNLHPYDSDIVLIRNDSRVIGFDSKNNVRNYYYHNRVNAGFFICNAKALEWFTDEPRKLGMEHDFIQGLIDSGCPVFAYDSTEYIKDVGTIDRISLAEDDIEKGIVASRNLSNKQRCIFLDRDGTINILKGFISKVDDFDLFPTAADAIRKINRSGYLSIVVTNQPVVARGECTISGLEDIHKKMETLLGEKGAYIDDIVYCPHHPDKGFAGEIPELKCVCECRKPKPGMIFSSRDRWNIDLGQSWMIGDSIADILAGKSAGVKTVFIGESASVESFPDNQFPDFVADNLLDAVDLILEGTK